MEKLAEKYKQILEHYFAHEEEEALFEVTELGKSLMLEKRGPDVLLDIHSMALSKIINKLDPMEIGKKVMQANDVLLNAIMAYAMNFYNVIEMLDVERKKIEEMNKKLQELDRMKSMFIASMSHELRTPLNSILGFTGIMLMGLSGELNPEQRRQLTMVKSSAEQLLNLITDIIDISKIEAGKLEIEPELCHISEVLKKVLDSMEVLAKRKGLQLKREIPPNLEFYIDKRRFIQIITNLVGNAIKYTPKGEVEVSAKLEEKNLIVKVRDTGIGIKEEDFDQLFKPFSQLHAKTDEFQEGTGLGLYISKKLVELLNGEIRVDSEYGKGSVFTVIFKPINENRN